MLYRLVRPMQRKDSSNQQFRKRIPVDLKDRLVGELLIIPIGDDVVHVTITSKMDAIRLSLRTSNPSEVKQRHAEVIGFLEGYFENLRNDTPLSLTHRNAVALSGEVYRAWASDPDTTRITSITWAQGKDGWTRVAQPSDDNEMEILKAGFAKAAERVTELDSEDLRSLGERLLQLRGYSPKKFDDKSWDYLLKEIQRALRDGLQAGANKAGGDYRPDPVSERFPAWKQPEEVAVSPASSLTLMDILEGWWKEAQARDFSNRTYESYKKAVTSLADFLKHENAQRITPDDIIRFKDFLLNEVDQPRGKRLSAKTVKDSYLAGLKSVFNWAVANRRLNANPAKGITIKLGKKKKLRDSWFTRDEINALLSASLNVAKGKSEPVEKYALKRWVPWLLAYTGARAGEIVQLRKKDVRLDSGLWIISITPEAGIVKTKERRDIPLHPHLIEMGFSEYVKAAKGERLFLWQDDTDIQKALKYAIKILRSFIRTIITDPDVQPNHAWRHTFKTYGTEAGVSDKVLDAICGHAPRTVGESYGGVTIQAKAKAIKIFPRFKADS